MSDSSSNPGLVSGHVKLCVACCNTTMLRCHCNYPLMISLQFGCGRAQGVVESAIGSVTGNQSWTQAGEQAKEAGVSELKSYQEQNPPSGDGSKIESKIGQAVGCEGMVNEGEAGSSSSSSTIDSDAQAKGAIPGGAIGGTSLPGNGVSSAQGASETKADCD